MRTPDIQLSERVTHGNALTYPAIANDRADLANQMTDRVVRDATARDAPWLLNASSIGDIEAYLLSQRAIDASETPISVARAGAGNMNLALRVKTRDGRSFVVKQGRPWVEKFAQIPAPFERTLVEAAFYGAVRSTPSVARMMPAVLHVDVVNHVLLLEDIGEAGDFTSVYGDGRISDADLASLLDWLDRLAAVRVNPDDRATFSNRAMRALNHEHIFRFPLDPANGLDLDRLTGGLQAESRLLAGDARFTAAVAALGHRYLADGDALVHGDYFPGSWLKADPGLRVIDPEFCFLGDPEFDYGVMAAHLAMARCPPAAIQHVCSAAERRRLDTSLVARYAGVEIMRRLIGVAQLPLPYGLDRKRTLLHLSRRLLVEPHPGFE